MVFADRFSTYANMSTLLCTMLAVQTASASSLGTPADGSSQSGIGLIRGWVCEATEVTIRIDDGEEIPAVYGNPRADTESVCGDSDNGFELLWNWNLSGDGEHTVEAFADGMSIGSSVFTVTTLGLGEFVRGLSGTFTLDDFPTEGQNTTVTWSETEQNFLISAVEEPGLLNPTGQTACYDDTQEIECPETGLAFYGQDAQTAGRSFSFTNNGDGTVSDNVTGLLWQKSPDTDGNGALNTGDKLTFDQALSYCEDLELAGKSDWQLPNIKALYSLIDFTGIDPSGYEGTDASSLTPFIDTDYFDFAYGDTDAGERIIDAQFASSTQYVATVTEDLLFGVNFADGRIKGYGLSLNGADKTFNVYCVHGGEGYGGNDFENNGDGTISDHSTSLMWAQQDSGIDVPAGLNWEETLVWVELKNADVYLGYSDWRLPNVKEMQSLLDYTRSPDTTGSAAIDPLFDVTSIINEAGQGDFPMYWSGTTHANMQNGTYAAYVAFGRAMGYMNNNWRDVHGAGAQRSDPKSGDPADYPTGNGPQGDAIRIYNHARLVRDL